MNDFIQPQNNTPLNGNTNVPQNTPASNVVPVFQVDVSGLTNRASANEPTIIGSSPESGPIIIDKKIEPIKEIDKKVEFGNETVQNIEKGIEELKAEKSETVIEAPSGGPSITSSVQPQKDEKPQAIIVTPPSLIEKKASVKYSGYPIDEALLNDPELVKDKKGKGDPNDGFTAVLLLLDRLFRIRDKAK